jgi:AbiU2
MQKRQLSPLNLATYEQFAEFIRILWDELYWADVYYGIFKEGSKLTKRYETSFCRAPFFWAYTLRAHCQTALVYVHRLYDQNADSFNLHRFLLTTRNHPEIFETTAVLKRRVKDPNSDALIKNIGPLDHAQLERDIEFCSDKNPKVKILKTWRDRITFHKDERELFRPTPFEKDYPLLFGDIDLLIGRGFEILNRYSEYFDTTKRSRNLREWKDMEFVFEALTNHTEFGPRV